MYKRSVLQKHGKATKQLKTHKKNSVKKSPRHPRTHDKEGGKKEESYDATKKEKCQHATSCLLLRHALHMLYTMHYTCCTHSFGDMLDTCSTHAVHKLCLSPGDKKVERRGDMVEMRRYRWRNSITTRQRGTTRAAYGETPVRLWPAETLRGV